tara:strand:+ start:4134 stop:5615 length:1482 start_codon:yes stop_codon:yes gene_type:complete
MTAASLPAEFAPPHPPDAADSQEVRLAPAVGSSSSAVELTSPSSMKVASPQPTAALSSATDLAKLLGPGIIFASSAIGVSHLVQCTRSGALFGMAPSLVIVGGCLLKYPFYEFSSRFANVTGTSILDGYRKIGRWLIITCFTFVLLTNPINMAAIGVVTAAFCSSLFNTTEGATPAVSGLLFVGVGALLLLGGFKRLDQVIKGVTLLLVATTLIAVVVASVSAALGKEQETPTGAQGGGAGNVSNATADDESPSMFSVEGGMFMVALTGWMPTPLDTGTTMNSLWTVERFKTSGYHPPLRLTLQEFAASYVGTALLALAFLALGALLAPQPGTSLPNGAAAFADAVVDLYASVLGGWSVPLVGVSACCAMIGTLLTMLDGYARTLVRAAVLCFDWRPTERALSRAYAATLCAVGAAGYILLVAFPGSLHGLVDLATSLSFMVSPAVGAANWHLVTRRAFPEHARPPRWLRMTAAAGMACLVIASLLFFVGRVT